ncbi:MAG: HAD family hydrolase [Isosphaeraceae bacterium]
MREPVLIFDFGNVVSFFDYLRACEPFGRRLGLTGPAFMKRLQEGGFGELLVRFESGRLSPEDFAGRVMELADLQLGYDEFVRGWEDIFWINEPVARLVEQLKASGYTLLLGSNTNILHATFFRQRFATTLDRFDRLILSYEVGHMKPSGEFYRACVEASGTSADSCIFIDDMPENVEGARRAGLEAIHFVDTPTLVAELNRRGVEVLSGQG